MPVELRTVRFIPKMVTVELELDPSLALVDVEALDAFDLSDMEDTRRVGTEWLASAKSLALSAPSVVVPLDRNIVLNPRHPDMAKIRSVSLSPFTFDPRLVGTALR